MEDMSNEEIALELRSLYDKINKIRRIAASTQDEGGWVAARAMMFIYLWQSEEIQSRTAKDEAMKILKKAVLAQDPANPWESLIISQSAIEYFLSNVDGGI